MRVTIAVTALSLWRCDSKKPKLMCDAMMTMAATVIAILPTVISKVRAGTRNVLRPLVLRVGMAGLGKSPAEAKNQGPGHVFFRISGHDCGGGKAAFVGRAANQVPDCTLAGIVSSTIRRRRILAAQSREIAGAWSS